MSQIPRVSHGFLDRRNPNQVDPAWYVFLQQMAVGVNGIPAQIDASGKQNYSALLSDISTLTGAGFLVLQGGNSATLRTLQTGDGISITNPAGTAGNPVISLEDLADSGIGDDGLVVLTRDDKGRIAGMAPATAEDLAFDDSVHGLALVNVQAALDAALGALPYFSDTAPDPDVHPYWIDTTDLTPYVWYDDGTSAQWIALDALASLAASAVTYDNTTSGLAATNVQDAIDEIAAGGSGPADTDALTEGATNLYFTDERAQDATAALIAAGTHSGISFSYNDAGNSLSATVTGGGVSSGTSNPGSPTTGQLFFRTDLGWMIYYDGTRWLTCQEFPIGNSMAANTALTASGQLVFRAPVETTYQMYLTRLVFSTFVQTTNSGTAYWNIELYRYDQSNASTLISNSITTQSDGVNGWYRKVATINAALDATARELTLLGQKTLSPGSLSYAGQLFYRLIVT